VEPTILDAVSRVPDETAGPRHRPRPRPRCSPVPPTTVSPSPVTPPAHLPRRGLPGIPDATNPRRDRSDAAFAALYHDEYLGLVRLAYLILGSREQAEEIVQDAFVRLHGRWLRVENPGGYLRISVINGCRDARRRLLRYRAREPRLAVRAETWDAPDELSDAMAALPVRQRTVLVLRYYGGLNEAEIAETLRIRPGTVKSSLHRALRRLRRELTGDGEPDTPIPPAGGP
jgi:RNA polymerase sigma factor (sigma-70 family)